MDDLTLIRQVREGCSDSFAALQEQYAAVVSSVAGTYSGMARSGVTGAVDFQDCQEEILHNAITTFDPERGMKFSSWLHATARYFFLRRLNRDKRLVFAEPASIIEIADGVKQHFDPCGEPLTEYVFDLAAQSRDIRIPEILAMRYSSPKFTYEEIGAKLNLSAQQVKNIHDKFIELCKKKLVSKNNPDII